MIPTKPELSRWLLVALSLSSWSWTGCLTPHTSARSTQPAADPPGWDEAAIVWDGARTPRYQLSRMSARPWNGGAGWASCDSRPSCPATFALAESVGFEGGRGLRFHGEGPGWVGGGWNWANWRPEMARDFTSYTRLGFQIRVQSADTASHLESLAVALASPSSDQSSVSVRIQDYEPAFMDGRWHRVTIPLASLATTKTGTQFDLSTTWELRISARSADPNQFDILLDRIAAEK